MSSLTTKQALFLGAGAFLIILAILGLSKVNWESEFIKHCIKSENRTFYTSPIYVCTGYNENGGCFMQIPIGGGEPYIKSVCVEYKETKNPKWKK